MSVTAIAGHVVRPVRRPAQTPPALTITIDLTLPGELAGAGLVRGLDALRVAIQQAAGGTVTVSGAPAGAPAGPPPVDSAAGTDRAVVRILPEQRAVLVGEEEIRLSRLEFDLLLHFAEHPRRVFSRVQLLQAVWGYTQASRRTVDVHVRRLRAKLDGVTPLLTTVRGVGYRLDNAAGVAVVRS